MHTYPNPVLANKLSSLVYKIKGLLILYDFRILKLQNKGLPTVYINFAIFNFIYKTIKKTRKMIWLSVFN